MATKSTKSRYWTAIVYPESVDALWERKLNESGIAWACSPLHDQDLDEKGNYKKPHWHIIIQWGNTTTVNAVNDLLKACCGDGCTICLKCVSPEGAYAYLTHENSPDKFRYTEEPKKYNGFKVASNKKNGSEEVAGMRNIIQIISDNDVKEFCDLMQFLDDEQFELVMKRAYFVNKFIESYRFKRRETK